jgi:hypothetical protein
MYKTKAELFAAWDERDSRYTAFTTADVPLSNREIRMIRASRREEACYVEVEHRVEAWRRAGEFRR